MNISIVIIICNKQVHFFKSVYFLSALLVVNFDTAYSGFKVINSLLPWHIVS